MHMAEKWKTFMESASVIKYNVANVNSMTELDTSNVYNYVKRCLAIANTHKRNLTIDQMAIINTTLQWMDIAKVGSLEDRTEWERTLGVPLDIHNFASAEIFMFENKENYTDEFKDIVYTLIRTHGLIGQYLMGEVKLRDSRDVLTIDMDKKELKRILRVLNHAIIAGVSDELWKKTNLAVNKAINILVDGYESEYDMLSRLQILFPAFKNVETLTDEEKAIYSQIFEVGLWYPTISLQNFSRKEINTIFKTILDWGIADVDNITFFDFSQGMSYDRDGKRRENVYKKRIAEVLLRQMADGEAAACEKEHVRLFCTKKNYTMSVHLQFTPVCEALINFCVEAERSGMMNYQKNILTIFDIFGFRRDVFDRLSNEEAYLETMNNAQNSTKLNILEYIQGDLVVDVGSGGGILLDAIEKKYPDKSIIGTDISANVIEVLNKKIQDEQHNYRVITHNFVEDNLPLPVDNIIFSSILHEIYSYTETNGRKFNHDSLYKALSHARDSLADGGRIIIRDGILTDSDSLVSVRIKDEDTLRLALSYLKDFKGLTHLRNGDTWTDLSIDGNVIRGDINLIREMLYTITWGAMSYPQEVLEQFGYYTLHGYETVLRGLGMKIVESKQFTESGYPEHLDDKVELLDFTWDDIPSNCIIVAEAI